MALLQFILLCLFGTISAQTLLDNKVPVVGTLESIGSHTCYSFGAPAGSTVLIEINTTDPSPLKFLVSTDISVCSDISNAHADYVATTPIDGRYTLAFVPTADIQYINVVTVNTVNSSQYIIQASTDSGFVVAKPEVTYSGYAPVGLDIASFYIYITNESFTFSIVAESASITLSRQFTNIWGIYEIYDIHYNVSTPVNYTITPCDLPSYYSAEGWWFIDIKSQKTVPSSFSLKISPHDDNQKIVSVLGSVPMEVTLAPSVYSIFKIDVLSNSVVHINLQDPNNGRYDIRIGSTCTATAKSFNIPFSENLHNFVYIAGASGSQLIAIYNGQYFATTVNLTVTILSQSESILLGNTISGIASSDSMIYFNYYGPVTQLFVIKASGNPDVYIKQGGLPTYTNYDRLLPSTNYIAVNPCNLTSSPTPYIGFGITRSSLSNSPFFTLSGLQYSDTIGDCKVWTPVVETTIQVQPGVDSSNNHAFVAGIVAAATAGAAIIGGAMWVFYFFICRRRIQQQLDIVEKPQTPDN